MTAYINYYHFSIGRMGIVAQNEAITAVFFAQYMDDYPAIEKEIALLKKAACQLHEYFSGRRKNFDLPLEASGTFFQKQVWQALQTIPYGQTRSYKDIARQINNAKAIRAVGNANNTNPLAIIVPCHRVIGSKGDLIGYAGGIKIKEQLLNLENNNR